MPSTATGIGHPCTSPLAHRRDAARPAGVEADEPWIDPAVVALSLQRADGEWRYCPWLITGSDDLLDAAR